jgi:hypothetical protein
MPILCGNLMETIFDAWFETNGEEKIVMLQLGLMLMLCPLL